MSSTRDQVEQLMAEGRTGAEIARALGISKATVAYHRRRLGESPDVRCLRRYDWAAVQAYHDAGHGVLACLAHFGMNRASWYDAVDRGALVPRRRAAPLEQLLVRRSTGGSRGNLRRRLIREGYKEARCEACGLSEWRGAPLAMQLHHVNGDPLDDRLENLALLCPNCHAQTENWGGRNKGSRSDPDREAA